MGVKTKCTPSVHLVQVRSAMRTPGSYTQNKIKQQILKGFKKTSSPMGNDRSPESQHNVGDTIIYDAQRQTVFNLGNFKWDHFHSISDKNKTLSNISQFT